MEYRLKVVGRTLPVYMITAAGIIAVICALQFTDFTIGKPESVIHILMLTAMAGLSAYSDLGNHGKAGELSMLAILAALSITSAHVSQDIFAVSNLAHAPAVCMFILIAAIALMIGEVALLRASLIMGMLICIYSSNEFPGYEYLGHKFRYLMFLSEMFMFAGAVAYSFRLDKEKAMMPQLPVSKQAHKMLYPQEKDCLTVTYGKRCCIQAACITTACAMLAIADYLYEIEVPWFYLIALCLFMIVTIWQSSYSGFRYDNLMIAAAMLLKLIAELDWELAPAEYDYATLITMMDAFCAVAAAGRSRRLFWCGVIAETGLRLAAAVEYYLDPAVFLFRGGQIVIISKLLITIAAALYAYSCWSNHDDGEEECGNETIRQIQE